MIERNDLIDWFEDPEQRGIASNTELAELLGESEGFVRAEGRRRDVRRVGSAMAWSLDDALELYDALDDDADEDDEDQDEDEEPEAEDEDLDDDENEDDD